MKSRVKKYADLHQEIASDTESTVENSDLSHFANRLSEIDDQFERVHTSRQDVIAPSRARKREDSNNDSIDPMVDTFETDYLKGFLDEVKEYNVKKGYRDISDTQANILDDLRGDFSNQNKKPLKIDKPHDLEETQTIYSEKELAKIAEELIDEDHHYDQEKQSELEATQVFGQELLNLSDLDSDSDYDGNNEEELEGDLDNDLLSNDTEDLDENENDQTISMAIQDMSYSDDDYEDEESNSFELEEDNFEDEDEDAHKNRIKQELFEQTQTLSRKVLDLEQNIDEMSTTTSKTNRLLHVVLSLLLFAIIVVALLIAAQFIDFM